MFQITQVGKTYTEVDIIRNDFHGSPKSITYFNLSKLINVSPLGCFHVVPKANIKRLDQYKMKD